MFGGKGRGQRGAGRLTLEAVLGGVSAACPAGALALRVEFRVVRETQARRILRRRQIAVVHDGRVVTQVDIVQAQLRVSPRGGSRGGGGHGATSGGRRCESLRRHRWEGYDGER